MGPHFAPDIRATANPLYVPVSAMVKNFSLCETRSLTLVALRHCLRIALS
jgi:hypothetical protein